MATAIEAGCTEVVQTQLMRAALSGDDVASNGVQSVAVTVGGTGYADSFPVTFTGGAGSGAAGVATAAAGVLQSVDVTEPGTGYTSAPTADLSAGNGNGATTVVTVAAFAQDPNAFDGLMNSAIAETDFGAAITDLGRADLIAARRRLFAAESYTDDLGWLLSEAVAKQLEITARSATGGSDYLYQDGMVDSGARWLPAAESVHLGKTGVTAPAVLLQRSAALLLIWGAGIAMNRLQLPGETRVRFDLQVQASFAMLDPRRAAVIKQA